MIIIIAIVVIAIILIRIYYKGNKFWDKQPVSRSLKQSEGIITNIMPDILPSKKGQIVRYLGNQSYSDIGLFLSKNYIKGYIYDTAKINWSLSMPYMVERNRIAIYSHNRIISFISGKPFIVKLNNKELKLHYIDYLSVHKEHRNKNLAPIIISNIAKLCYTPEYTCYLFKKENNPLPFKYISKCKYFYYDLMRESPKVALDQKKYNPLSTRSLVKISFGNRTPAELPTDLIVSAVIEFHPILQNCITNVITQLIGKIKCKCLKITCRNPGPYWSPQAPGLGSISIRMLIAQNWPPLATAT